MRSIIQPVADKFNQLKIVVYEDEVAWVKARFSSGFMDANQCFQRKVKRRLSELLLVGETRRNRCQNRQNCQRLSWDKDGPVFWLIAGQSAWETDWLLWVRTTSWAPAISVFPSRTSGRLHRTTLLTITDSIRQKTIKITQNALIQLMVHPPTKRNERI